ncbi:uncharacterized protein LOC127834350 isoform X2 [Dreissena polymorpha]|uniref:uncharacterized protein LOC127834350 isoform X2 n=1 Tax=Dreissena polymorpha TaxID=45954 RepID=UPI0022651314|nr:uncharacterized protein LOC127834350 isoform X2 [Dreissena polymorpha]
MKINNIQIVLSCLITVTVVQSVVFLTITIYWSRFRNANNVPKTSQLCADCKDLVPEYDNSGIISQVEQFRTYPSLQCCGGTEDFLRLASQKVTKDTFYSRIRYMVTESVYSMCDSDVDQTPYVQAVGIRGYKPIGALNLLLWNENRKTVTQPSIHRITHLHEEGEIFIRRAGLYTVSSRLFLQANVTTLDGIFSHYIYVLSHKYGSWRMLTERKMLLGEHTKFSMINAVFKLDLHDRLSVAVTDMKNIDTNSDDNVFSVHFA